MTNTSNIILPSPHKVLQVVHETSAEYTFRVACDDEVNHGQFFFLSIPKFGEAPISVSAHGEGWVEFTIRKVGKLTEGIFGLAAGDTLFMRGPYGNGFPVESFKGKHLVVIAGGTGVSPVRSTLQYFYDHPDEVKSVTFIAGFKDESAVLFKEDLARFAEKFNTYYCLDNSEAPGFHKGFVTSFIKGVPFSEFDDYNVIIVGPPVMIGFTAKECVANGAEESNIWVSFERKMSCAVGKCGHCKIDETYVCLEGPVFNYIAAKNLLD